MEEGEFPTTSWLMRPRFSRAVCHRTGSLCITPMPSLSSLARSSKPTDVCTRSPTPAVQQAATIDSGCSPDSQGAFENATLVSKAWKERCELLAPDCDFSFPSPVSSSIGRLSDCTSDYFSSARDDEGLQGDSCLMDVSPSSSCTASYSSATSSSTGSSGKHSPRRFFGCRKSTGSEGGSERGQSTIHRVRSWSQYFAKLGGEKAVPSLEKWMVDLSQLLLGERFACGNHSRLYHGIYKGSPVAVKVIRQPEDEGALCCRLEQIFTQEVTILSSVQHTNVIRFIAACKKTPVLCVITEYLSGGSLRSFLQKQDGRPLPTSQIVRMALDIACGMEYLHMKGVLHRDLKSENLVLSEDGCLKIVDFGVSCLESKCDHKAADPGTYRWMAPEMLQLKPYTRKVDVYGFGIVLWELVTTRLPYEDVSPVQAAFSVVNKNRRPSIPDDCPDTLGDLMKQCWSVDPNERPEFWEILRTLTVFEDSLNSSNHFMLSPDRHDFLPGWLR